MGQYKDLTGQKFGRLTALYRLHNISSKTRWLCICDCGNLKEARQDQLYNGRTKSCNCLYKDSNATHGKSNTRLYNIWQNMKARCYQKTTRNYNDWGGRGIKVCDEWKHNFENFYNWAMKNGYQENLTIERIDVDGNYEPSNCCWLTIQEQQQNKRNNRVYNINGETHCLKEWCDILNLNYKTVLCRVNRLDWPIKKALELEASL